MNITKNKECLISGLIGRIVPEFNSEDIRELIHIPFRIVYILESKVIYVVRIWRSERLLKLADSSNDDEI